MLLLLAFGSILLAIIVREMGFDLWIAISSSREAASQQASARTCKQSGSRGDESQGTSSETQGDEATTTDARFRTSGCKATPVDKQRRSIMSHLLADSSS